MVECIPGLDVKYVGKNIGMNAALNVVLSQMKFIKINVSLDLDWMGMRNNYENVGQDIEIESIDSLECYLVIAGKRINKFTGETCYQDAQRLAFDILTQRIYGKN